MINFKKIGVEDFRKASGILKASGIENCEHCFATMILWSYRHPVEIAIEQNTVFMRSAGNQHTWYLWPAGEMPVKQAVDMILADAARLGTEASIYGIDRSGAAFLENNYGELLNITEERDAADYIYLATDLISLPGKNYQKKRNHCSRFVRENPDYRFIPITAENAHRAVRFEYDWCARYDCGKGRDLASEQEGIVYLLNNFDKMDLMGAMIETNGEIVAMSIAAPINDRMVDVMVEKGHTLPAYPRLCDEPAW